MTTISTCERRRNLALGTALPLLLALSIDGAAAAVDGTETTLVEETAPLAKAGYARERSVERITLDLTSPVGHVERRDGDQLIIWFDQPRTFDLEALAARSNSLLLKAHTPEAGPTRWLVLDIAPESLVKSERQKGDRLIITIEREGTVAASGEEKAVPAATPVKSETPVEGTKEETAKRSNDHKAAARETPSAVKSKDKADSPAKAADIIPSSSAEAADAVPVPEDEPAPKPRPLIQTETSPEQAPDRAQKTQATPKAQAVRPAPARRAGELEIDETALDRALERSLTREGAVLLPFGLVEIEPSFSYARRELDSPTLINLFGFPAFGETQVTRDDYTVALAARIGLPLDAQLELDLPFSYVDQSVMTTIGFDPVDVTDDDTGAFGDLGVGLAKSILRESGWWPDLVARVRWDSQTGKSADNGIALGGGAHELTGSLSLVKSQDPLAFFGTIAYEKTFEDDDLDPGDRIGVSIGTVLAASPETSLRASLRQDFVGDAEFEDDNLDGTDQVVATLNLGASSVLGRGVLLDAAAEIGLTDDAPDYTARLSLPIRFDLRRTFSLGRSDNAEGEEESDVATPAAPD